MGFNGWVRVRVGVQWVGEGEVWGSMGWVSGNRGQRGLYVPYSPLGERVRIRVQWVGVEGEGEG